MTMNSADALPILKDVLKQRDPCRVELRKQAVYMISQKRTDRTSCSTLLDVARNDPSPDVRVRRRVLAFANALRSGDSGARFDSLFAAATTELRKKAMFALSQLQRRPSRPGAAPRGAG